MRRHCCFKLTSVHCLLGCPDKRPRTGAHKTSALPDKRPLPRLTGSFTHLRIDISLSQTVVKHQEYKISVLLHFSVLQMQALFVMSLKCRGAVDRRKTRKNKWRRFDLCLSTKEVSKREPFVNHAIYRPPTSLQLK